MNEEFKSSSEKEKRPLVSVEEPDENEQSLEEMLTRVTEGEEDENTFIPVPISSTEGVRRKDSDKGRAGHRSKAKSGGIGLINFLTSSSEAVKTRVRQEIHGATTTEGEDEMSNSTSNELGFENGLLISPESMVDGDSGSVGLENEDDVEEDGDSVVRVSNQSKFPTYDLTHSELVALTESLPEDDCEPTSLRGEMIVFKMEKVYLQRGNYWEVGTLTMTNYRLHFQPHCLDTSQHIREGWSTVIVPLASIFRVENVQSSKVQQTSITGASISVQEMIVMRCKDMVKLCFGFHVANECSQALKRIEIYSFPQTIDLLFAFSTECKHCPPKLNGWNLYDAVEEYKRMGLPNQDYRMTVINQNYELCPSYPQVLVVPSLRLTSDGDVRLTAGFRSKARLPVLTWKHPDGPQTIWRSAQPKAGMRDRCSEDERYLTAIRELNPRCKKLLIFDCRPRLNAVANKLNNKGYENTDTNYKDCLIRFMDIENIHVMRSSYQTLAKACTRDYHGAGFLKQVQESGWLVHLSLILKATLAMVVAIDRDKQSVLSHCSDGWDRTAQLCALTQLCLDPYYRTLQGFMVLVEKEWCSFGFKFALRTGHLGKNHSDPERSPIFTQFLDAVWQLTQQFPRHFQFNSRFLVTIAYHLHSCRFGTFVFDSDRERRLAKVHETAISLWTYMLGSAAALRGEFLNSLYEPSGTGLVHTGKSKAFPPGGGVMAGAVLYPSWTLKKISLWSDHFLRSSEGNIMPLVSLTPAMVNLPPKNVKIGLGVGFAGSVPPHGAATPSLLSSASYLESCVASLHRRNAELEALVLRLRKELDSHRKSDAALPTSSQTALKDQTTLQETASETSSQDTSAQVSKPSDTIDEGGHTEKYA